MYPAERTPSRARQPSGHTTGLRQKSARHPTDPRISTRRKSAAVGGGVRSPRSSRRRAFCVRRGRVRAGWSTRSAAARPHQVANGYSHWRWARPKSRSSVRKRAASVNRLPSAAGGTCHTSSSKAATAIGGGRCQPRDPRGLPSRRVRPSAARQPRQRAPGRSSSNCPCSRSTRTPTYSRGPRLPSGRGRTSSGTVLSLAARIWRPAEGRVAKVPVQRSFLAFRFVASGTNSAKTSTWTGSKISKVSTCGIYVCTGRIR